MTQPQMLIFLVLAVTVILFIWGRWRHDLVAMAALLGCVLLGLLRPEEAFLGFGHPAVITVACVLVLSKGLQLSGAVDAMMQKMLPSSDSPTVMITVLMSIGALFSAFMNNVGAMALLMPVAIQVATKLSLPPGRVLMPLAFGTILGGMTTLVGTPPNIIVSGFRAETGSQGFAMFDFTPVGLTVAVVGVVFVALIGWRLVPSRKQAAGSSFDTGTYLAEVRVEEGSQSLGKSLRQIDHEMDETDAQVVGLVRNAFRVSAPSQSRILRAGDILIIEAEPESLSQVLSKFEFKLVEDRIPPKVDKTNQSESAEVDSADEAPAEVKKESESDDIVLQELVVMPRSAISGRTAKGLQIRGRYGVNLLAISRRGRRSIKRLRLTRIEAGDVLLMQGELEAISDFAASLGCMPLAQRAIGIIVTKRVMLALFIMVLAVTGAATGLIPTAISFALGVLAYMALNIVPLQSAYDAVDWSVIVLLGALIPVASVTASTGAADLLAKALLDNFAQGHPVVALGLILVITMSLSDFMNNAATAAVMCPIAISTASQLGVNPDSFLMSVAIGASCAFLTPIGHQNNTLILGPGGFRFGDYWKMGLPLELLVVAISLPLLLMVWPL
ncbi:SLC13 family permease [Shewanella algidipiscicola]|uniref:SLC13 family permease n=1 Tax=Shewanella algidipiscicola TaxID=614070 RepID=UPI000D786094|nr:SLC13 family permease [Shewanella algidipiscicola]